jgi:hypothetical protein
LISAHSMNVTAQIMHGSDCPPTNASPPPPPSTQQDLLKTKPNHSIPHSPTTRPPQVYKYRVLKDTSKKESLFCKAVYILPAKPPGSTFPFFPGAGTGSHSQDLNQVGSSSPSPCSSAVEKADTWLLSACRSQPESDPLKRPALLDSHALGSCSHHKIFCQGVSHNLCKRKRKNRTRHSPRSVPNTGVIRCKVQMFKITLGKRKNFTRELEY